MKTNISRKDKETGFRPIQKVRASITYMKQKFKLVKIRKNERYFTKCVTNKFISRIRITHESG